MYVYNRFFVGFYKVFVFRRLFNILSLFVKFCLITQKKILSLLSVFLINS